MKAKLCYKENVWFFGYKEGTPKNLIKCFNSFYKDKGFELEGEYLIKIIDIDVRLFIGDVIYSKGIDGVIIEIGYIVEDNMVEYLIDEI